MRLIPLLLLTLPLLLLCGCDAAAKGESPRIAPEASGPHDPDLDLGAACAEGPPAKALAGALPGEVKELVVLWPRAGTLASVEPCVAVARLTLVDHQGKIITLSILLHGGPAPEARDFRVLAADAVPRAELELAPSPEAPNVLVRLAGAPATSREGLETTVDFLDLPALVAALGAMR